MMIDRRAFALFIGLIAIQVTHAEKLESLHLPVLPGMTGMTTKWVSKTMVYNTHPMSIQHFRHDRDIEDVMQYYASLWKLKGHGELKPQLNGKDHTIGHTNNGYTFSVQGHNVPGGSEGTLVVTRNRKFHQEPLKFPRYPDMQIIARIHNIDFGIRAETLTFRTTTPVSVIRQWYQSTLSKAGWKIQPGLDAREVDILAYQKGKSLCQLSFIEQHPGTRQHSMVMIHWIKG